MKRTLVALTLAAVWAPPAAPQSPSPVPVGQDEPVSALPREGDHRYRLVGKVRPLLFWIGNNNVGGARLTWQPLDDSGRALDLLIGADPERAPRGVDAWGYIREEMHGDRAGVFGIRSVNDAASLSEAELALGRDDAAFGVLCAAVGATQARAWTTTVIVPRGVSYRHFDRLLDAVASAPRWTSHETTRLPGTAPGFLAALDRLISGSVQAARAGAPHRAAPVRYLYKGGQYELRLRSEKRIDALTVGKKTYQRAVRGEFEIGTLATGDTTRFTITYGTIGDLAGVPLRAAYEPRWWLKLELALDDDLGVPADPAADPAMLARIRRACAAAMGEPLS
ncbi:MAG: hypothetical protein IT176_09790 [Acidobacteria bacterium]|nr:hypothetical protein [Acidobacteriota bacterium]